MPKFNVESNIKHDGDRYETGDEIELTTKQAESMLASGVISSATDASFTQEEIITAIGELDGDDETLWTKSGVPKVPALEVVLDGKITIAQRDEAWNAFSAE